MKSELSIIVQRQIVASSLATMNKNRKAYDLRWTKKFAEIKNKCPHDWCYEPDPSGNNDSGYYCSVCGSWTRHKP